MRAPTFPREGAPTFPREGAPRSLREALLGAARSTFPLVCCFRRAPHPIYYTCRPQQGRIDQQNPVRTSPGTNLLNCDMVGNSAHYSIN